jgi:AraC-like DNA-binding protein
MRTDLKQKRANEDHFPYILNYIDTVYNLNISVKEIAKNIGYSYDYFRELFQERMGISVKEYLLNKKLGYAKALLVSTDYTLAEIASMSGFSSASHLCLVFRSKVGKTPLEYLKTHPKDNSNSEQYYLTEAENTAHLHTKSKHHPAIR